jgi:hypothetical protein
MCLLLLARFLCSASGFTRLTTRCLSRASYRKEPVRRQRDSEKGCGGFRMAVSGSLP